jgi:cleavage and polyadenylation specificity factor subunit 3
LAVETPENGVRVEGVLVAKDYTYRLIAPSDLPEFTDLVPATVSQRLVIPCHAPFSLVKWHLESMYGRLKTVGNEDGDSFLVSLPYCPDYSKNLIFVGF